MKRAMETIRYTTVLPEKDVMELKELAAGKYIPSVNAGIREAVEAYIELRKKEIYAQRMGDAVKDVEFMKRTLDAQESFHNTESKVDGEW
jgi:hypothetical protein